MCWRDQGECTGPGDVHPDDVKPQSISAFGPYPLLKLQRVGLDLRGEPRQVGQRDDAGAAHHRCSSDTVKHSGASIGEGLGERPLTTSPGCRLTPKFEIPAAADLR